MLNMVITNQIDPIAKEYRREVALIPDYSMPELSRKPMLKLTPPVEETAMKSLGNTINYISPSTALYNSQNTLKFEAQTPLQLLAEHLKPGSLSMAPNLDELLKQPPLGLEERLKLEMAKLPNDYLRFAERASSGEPMFGHNPNPSVMSYHDIPKPYMPRSSN